jgi:maleate cis-trans isomerase
VLALAALFGERVRLLSPYKEHLSQAFARYFMRVGLPRPLADE